MEKQVLLIEDNELNRRLFSDLLTILKVGVTTAKNGTDALKLLKEKKFDLVLTELSGHVVDFLRNGSDFYQTV